jgi:serine/threonine protein kinase
VSEAIDVRAALAEIAAEPEAVWPQLVRARFAGDPALAAQALCWLEAARAPLEGGDPQPRLPGGRYRLGLRLGGGATAQVWQAYDNKLGRHVAIKVLAAGDRDALAEVLAEARAACDVVSDQVVRVLDVQDERDPAYLVMELVGEHDPQRGELVAGASAAVTKPRDLDEAARWVRDAARGVHDAHLRDVFHRDIKPANVLVTPVSRRARIADFGLAVSAAAGVAAISLVRGAVRVAGTPEFMAPEQARGLPIALDPRGADDRARLVAIDVWGLGALLYALAAGHPPWRGTALLEPWEIAASGAPPPPLAKVPARLRRVIDRAMALDPAARYASAGELASELDAYLARRPTSRDRSRALRGWLWSRRNPQLAVTALVAVALAIGTLVAYVATVRLRDERAGLQREMEDQEHARALLATLAANTRAVLASTEDDLRREQEALAQLQRRLAEGEREYQDILAAKEKALRDADAATRALVEELARAHADRDAAQLGRALYQGYWAAARGDADRAGKDRDQAAAARVAAESARDAADKARDAADAARTAAETELARLGADATAREAHVQELERRIAELQAAASAAAAAARAVPARDAGAPRSDAAQPVTEGHADHAE